MTNLMELLEAGHRMSRRCWDTNEGKRRPFVFKREAKTVPADAETARLAGVVQGRAIEVRSYCMMLYADGSIGPWWPSNDDLFGEDDWEIYEDD